MDIIIRNPASEPKTIHVIECKVGAPLEPHQNPKLSAFLEDGGYGRQMIEHFADERKEAGLRYIVLGLEEDLKLESGFEKNGIRCAQRWWRNLADECPEEPPLIKNLIESLGTMGIEGFRMKEAEKLNVTKGITDARMAWQVIQTVIHDKLMLKRGQFEWDAGEVDGTAYFGAYMLNRANSAPVTIPLERPRKQARQLWAVAWFGYWDNGKEMGREVWVYCDSKEGAAAAVQKYETQEELKQLRPEARAGDGEDYVILREASPTAERGDLPKRCDVDWFLHILKLAELAK